MIYLLLKVFVIKFLDFRKQDLDINFELSKVLVLKEKKYNKDKPQNKITTAVASATINDDVLYYILCGWRKKSAAAGCCINPLHATQQRSNPLHSGRHNSAHKTIQYNK